MECASIPVVSQSIIDDRFEAAILEDHHIIIRQLAQELKIRVISTEKNHSRPFAHAKVVCTIYYPYAHTFSEVGRSHLPLGFFHNMP